MSEWINADLAVQMYIDVGYTENTFFRHAREGKIRKELDEEKQRGARYNRQDIEEIIGKRRSKNKQRLAIRAQRDGGSKTEWVEENDLPYLLALDVEMYGAEEAVDFSITRAWWKKNPYMCRVLYNAQNRKEIWGYTTIIPMRNETILKLLRREMHERDIRPEHILIYEKGKEYEVYATSIVIRPDKRTYTRDLLNSILNYWCNQSNNFTVSKVFAYADSEEGWNMIKHLFFAPRYDIGQRVFELDPNQTNPSKLITAFQNCIKEMSELTPRLTPEGIDSDKNR